MMDHVNNIANRVFVAVTMCALAFILLPAEAFAAVGDKSSGSPTNNDLTKLADNGEELVISLGETVLLVGVIIAALSAFFRRNFREFAIIFGLTIAASMALDGSLVDAAKSVMKSLVP